MKVKPESAGFTGIRAHIPPHEGPIQVKPTASKGFTVPKTLRHIFLFNPLIPGGCTTKCPPLASPLPPPKSGGKGENSGLHALQIDYRNPSRVFTCLHLIWERFKLDPLCFFSTRMEYLQCPEGTQFWGLGVWFNHGSSVGAGFTPGESSPNFLQPLINKGISL